jgi:hypothetical protein
MQLARCSAVHCYVAVVCPFMRGDNGAKCRFRAFFVGVTLASIFPNCTCAMAQAFSDRVANVFDVLEQHNPHTSLPAWTVGDSVQAMPGVAESDSEVDQEHQERIYVRSPSMVVA